MRPIYYLLNAHTPMPVEYETFAREFRGDSDRRRVARDQLGPAEISTVFLGIDHAAEGSPILFETMVFVSDAPGAVLAALDGYQRRYATWTEAEQGHSETVALVEAALATDLAAARQREQAADGAE